MTLSLGMEPGSHWWEANALYTAPSLHPMHHHWPTTRVLLKTSNCWQTYSRNLFYYHIRGVNDSRTCSLKQELKLSQLSVTTNPQNGDRSGTSHSFKYPILKIPCSKDSPFQRFPISKIPHFKDSLPCFKDSLF